MAVRGCASHFAGLRLSKDLRFAADNGDGFLDGEALLLAGLHVLQGHAALGHLGLTHERHVGDVVGVGVGHLLLHLHRIGVDLRGDAGTARGGGEAQAVCRLPLSEVDEEQLYYLMSRGLKHEEAEYLLIRGFLGQVIQTMPSNKVRQQMVEIIDEKLKTLNHHGRIT